jgi:hypothetical protein
MHPPVAMTERPICKDTATDGGSASDEGRPFCGK